MSFQKDIPNFSTLKDEGVCHYKTVPVVFWRQLLSLIIDSDYQKYEIKDFVERCFKKLSISNARIWENSKVIEDLKELMRELKVRVDDDGMDILMDCLELLIEMEQGSANRVNHLLIKNKIGFYFQEKTKMWEVVKMGKNCKVFVSHSFKDKKYALALVELLEDIGLKKGDIFYSSDPEYGVPLGYNIYDYLKEQFLQYDMKVIYILSDNYYSSAACLNEMGAAWVLQKEYTSILLPDFEYKEIKGAINVGEIGIKLGEEEEEYRLKELYEQLKDKFELPEMDERKWKRYIREFQEKIRGLV